MLQELNKPFHIGTARFTDETYNQNLNWKKRKKWDGCFYGFDKKLPTTIKTGELVFIVEMNNSQNMVMGIGLIKMVILPFTDQTQIVPLKVESKLKVIMVGSILESKIGSNEITLH